MRYLITMEPDSNGTLLVSFPDLPWVHTTGTDEADALAHAEDALTTALEFLIKERRPIPRATRGEGPSVNVPALFSAKIALHNELVGQHVNRAELARRLKVHRPQVDRLIDVRHASKVDQLEAAFAALGKRLEVAVVADDVRTQETRMRPAAKARASRKR